MDFSNFSSHSVKTRKTSGVNADLVNKGARQQSVVGMWASSGLGGWFDVGVLGC